MAYRNFSAHIFTVLKYVFLIPRRTIKSKQCILLSMIKCIVMFSGGLDSTIAVHLMKSMGFDVLALHFVLPFYSEVGNSHAEIKEKAMRLSVPLRIEEEGE